MPLTRRSLSGEVKSTASKTRSCDKGNVFHSQKSDADIVSKRRIQANLSKAEDLKQTDVRGTESNEITTTSGSTGRKSSRLQEKVQNNNENEETMTRAETRRKTSCSKDESNPKTQESPLPGKRTWMGTAQVEDDANLKATGMETGLKNVKIDMGPKISQSKMEAGKDKSDAKTDESLLEESSFTKRGKKRQAPVIEEMKEEAKEKQNTAGTDEKYSSKSLVEFTLTSPRRSSRGFIPNRKYATKEVEVKKRKLSGAKKTKSELQVKQIGQDIQKAASPQESLVKTKKEYNLTRKETFQKTPKWEPVIEVISKPLDPKPSKCFSHNTFLSQHHPIVHVTGKVESPQKTVIVEKVNGQGDINSTMATEADRQADADHQPIIELGGSAVMAGSVTQVQIYEPIMETWESQEDNKILLQNNPKETYKAKLEINEDKSQANVPENSEEIVAEATVQEVVADGHLHQSTVVTIESGHLEMNTHEQRVEMKSVTEIERSSINMEGRISDEMAKHIEAVVSAVSQFEEQGDCDVSRSNHENSNITIIPLHLVDTESILKSSTEVDLKTADVFSSDLIGTTSASDQNFQGQLIIPPTIQAPFAVSEEEISVQESLQILTGHDHGETKQNFSNAFCEVIEYSKKKEPVASPSQASHVEYVMLGDKLVPIQKPQLQAQLDMRAVATKDSSQVMISLGSDSVVQFIQKPGRVEIFPRKLRGARRHMVPDGSSPEIHAIVKRIMESGSKSKDVQSTSTRNQIANVIKLKVNQGGNSSESQSDNDGVASAEIDIQSSDDKKTADKPVPTHVMKIIRVKGNFVACEVNDLNMKLDTLTSYRENSELEIIPESSKFEENDIVDGQTEGNMVKSKPSQSFQAAFEKSIHGESVGPKLSYKVFKVVSVPKKTNDAELNTELSVDEKQGMLDDNKTKTNVNSGDDSSKDGKSVSTAATQTPIAGKEKVFSVDVDSGSESSKKLTLKAISVQLKKTHDNTRNEYIIVHLPDGTDIKKREVKRGVPQPPIPEEDLTMTEDGSFICLECNYLTVKKSNFIKHKRKHLGIRPHQCPKCIYRAATSSNLKRHIAIHDDVRRFNCNECGLNFRQKIHLERHIKYKHEVKNIKCPLCEYTCANENPDLKIHIKRRHMPEADGTITSFTCDECGLMTVSRRDLRQHKKFHKKGPELKLFCEHCSFVTDCESRLRRHMFIHTKEKPFQCGLCEYKATQKEHVLRHMRSQHQIHVERHVRKNSTDSSKSNSQSGDSDKETEKDLKLFDKADYSSTDKIFACNHCTMKFVKLINLYKHLYTQHKQVMPNPDGQEYQCVVCDFRTNNKKNLLVHMRKHNIQDQTPPSHVYSCVLCRYMNPRRRNLFQHMKKKHGIEIIMKEDGTTNCFLAGNAPVIIGREEGDTNVMSVSDIVTSVVMEEESPLQIVTEDDMTTANSIPISNVISIEDLPYTVQSTSGTDGGMITTHTIMSSSPQSFSAGNVLTMQTSTLAEHEAAEAIEGLQALAEQAGILESQTVELISNVEEVAGITEAHSEEIVAEEQVIEDSTIEAALQEAVIVGEKMDNQSAIQLSSEQLMELAAGDYVEINGEMYKVEIQ
ncbi:hypothetical protein CHS0354_033762 [Potamilus streckersoni]|uniref:C2H2-type domain-containing protein n=1 Tax=Potamilus streckersoni TaxID=2493646 RepID=A0AAE0S2G1_9BIVA|nr:hypothetical protein CHS0354_033762 [Potamilus streckersoni]